MIKSKAMLFSVLCAIALSLTACQPPQNTYIEDTAFVPDTGLDADSFVEGNLYFLAYHELGHALVSEFDLPIAGREEDAVDRLAIWMMTPVEDGDAPDYLMGAMQGWFLTASDVPLSDLALWGEHGTDQQRGYQIACLLYGDAPERFQAAADIAQLPEDRRETCVFEAQDNDHAWSSLLAPHTRPEGSRGAANSLTIQYTPTETYKDEAVYLRQIGVLEDVADIMLEYYAFEPGIVLEASECGEPNAFWSSEARRLTLCYELVADAISLSDALETP